MIVTEKYMDKYKISYKCHKKPDTSLGLIGFEADNQYVGRSFNGMIEMSPEWGSGTSILLDYKSFKQYFELLHQV